MKNEEMQGLFIGKDIKWEEIERHGFRVVRFLPFAYIENGKIKDFSKFMPYAYLSVDCPASREENTHIFMPVLHRIDFSHFWELYKERGVTSDEEVIVQYVPLKKRLGKLLGKMKLFPHLLIEVRPKGSLDEIYRMDEKSKDSDKDEWEELEERVHLIIACDPIEGWGK
jgi:hypothetical protein